MMTKTEKIVIRTEFIKLDSFYQIRRVDPYRRAGKEIVLAGMVKANGEVQTMCGKKIRPGDVVEADGWRFEAVAEEE